MEKYTYPETTFELCFYDRTGEIDSIQQYRTEEEARIALDLFNEPASTDMYKQIKLFKTEWLRIAHQTQLESLIISNNMPDILSDILLPEEYPLSLH